MTAKTRYRKAEIRNAGCAALAILLTLAAVPVAKSAEPAPAGPKGATVVGTVTWRLGNRVGVAIADGATPQPNEELQVGRPLLLVALAAQGKRVEAWGEWRPAGRIQLRTPRGARHWLGMVIEDAAPPQPPGGEATPNIQPGDIVYRLPSASAPSPAAKAPAPKTGRE